jgi:putative membrane protein
MKRSLAPVVIGVLALAAASGSTAAGRATQPSGQDQTWLKTSVQGDLFEIQGGKLALKTASSSTVKALAKRLVKDHSKSLADAKKTAAKLGIKLENTPTPSEQWELKVVGNFSSSDFDRWYSSLEVYDHRQDIQETTDELKLGSSPEVKALAKQDLPMLRMHLSLSQKAMRSS